MAAEGGNDITWFTYTGADGQDIPDDATHVIFVDVETIPARAFYDHASIIEVICHDKVEKIEGMAFFNCPSLRRLIMPGVKIAERRAIRGCRALTEVECGKLERIERSAFLACLSLTSINLPSARILEESAFSYCKVLTEVKFSSKLERIHEGAFCGCTSLERITIPLKDGMITDNDIFMTCVALNHVDLVEGALLNETIAALHFEEWRNDMNEEIDSINQILPNARAGGWNEGERNDGEKARAIRSWIRSVLDKVVRYKAKHSRLLNETGSTLQQALPHDIVMCSVLPFLQLPSNMFEGEALEEEEEEEEEEEASQNLFYSVVLMLVVALSLTGAMAVALHHNPAMSFRGEL